VIESRDNIERFHERLYRPLCSTQPVPDITGGIGRGKTDRLFAHTYPAAILMAGKETTLHVVLFSFVVQRMKVSYLVIAAAITAVALSSCALNQEGVGPNPAELPENNPSVTPGGPG
jgi:hypothetical protein